MTRGAPLRFLVGALALIVAAGVVIAHRGAPAPTTTPRTSGETSEPAAVARSATSVTAPAAPSNSSAAPTLDSIARDPAAASRAWLAHASDVVVAKQRRELGDEVAALLARPFDEALPRLRSLALDGNQAAASALVEIDAICRIEASRNRERDRRAPAATRYKHLTPAWATFVDALRAANEAAHAERTARCPDPPLPADFATQLIERFFRADNVEAQIEVAADNTDGAAAVADLRRLVANGAGVRAEYYLADRLLMSADADEQDEGLASYERLAPGDADVAARLAYCLSSGCEHFTARPDEAMPWMEQAAGEGNEPGYTMLMTSLDAGGDVAGGWAWSRYELELALAGCFESIVPSYVYVAQAASDEVRRRETLSPAEQNAGLARYYEITGKWEKKARERLSCLQ